MSAEDEVVLADIEAAGRLLTDSIARDSRFASCDLQDALDAARFSSHLYSTPPKESTGNIVSSKVQCGHHIEAVNLNDGKLQTWPAFVDVIHSRELPPVLIERYNAAGGQGTALCGIFPEIRRAWATVDDTLFLWRFDKWDGQCPEYSGEEQAICAVGLVKAKPGVFIEAIQHLIVLATPVELVLLGVCCSGSGVGGDPFLELTLQPLPQYTIPTDGVTMTCITHTDSGRIFLGGRDGHLYELIYTAGHGWQSRCRKVCHTGGLGNLLSRWVVPNSLKFGAVDAIVEVVVDEERHILYTRTQESKLQMFDLGKNGDGAPRKVAEESRVGEQRDSRGRSVGPRGVSRAPKANIVSISPISSAESKWLHLVAITSDGRRIYLSTTTSTGSSLAGVNGSTGVGGPKPSVLRVVMTRPAPSVGAVGVMGGFGSSPLGARTQSEGGFVIKAEAAHCSSGVLVVSDASPSTLSRLLVATRDLTGPAASSAGNATIGGSGSASRSMRSLREMVTILGVDGRALAIADVLPPPEQAAAVEFSVCEPGSAAASSQVPGDEMVRARRLWARGELATQHVLPRRRSVVLSTMGVMELAFNRPVDLLQKLLDSNTLRSVLEEFFQRYGASEAAAMCLLLAARLTSDEDNIVAGVIADRAAEAFEDPRLVGVPQMQGGGAATSGLSSGGGFNMGQVVQEAEPVFSGAHDGLCLATARLLRCVWEFPVMDVRKEGGAESNGDGGIISCRLPVEAMLSLEDKIRSLEQFLRARRNQRRGHYGRVMGVGDMSAYGERHSSPFGVDGFARGEIPSRSPLMITYETPPPRAGRAALPGSANKRQRLPHKELSPAELAAMEVRGMECIRRLLRRSGEALRLLQLLQQHHVGRLAQSLDEGQRRQLAQLTFHQLVCSVDGEQIATRLVAALMEYYVAPDGRGTVDDVSRKLRDGCPSYYNESDYQFYQAVESLERAAGTSDLDERDRLAKEALELLGQVPETADLLSVCQRFEDIRFYEAVVELPLRKARALDPSEDAFNESIDEGRRQSALAARRQCYDVVTNALRSLKGQSGAEGGNAKLSFSASAPGARLLLDESARESYIRQIVQLGVRWPDHAFHECLYQTMVELGLTQELLDLGGPDLVTFLQSAGNYQTTKASQVSSGPFKSPMPSTTPNSSRLRQPISGEQAKYLELLSRLYVHRRQHAQAAHVLLRLAERRQPEGASEITLEQRYEYLSNAVLQARSGSRAPGGLGLSSELSDSGLMELLEGKLSVLRFQQKIKEALDRIACGGSSEEVGSVPMEEDGFPFSRAFTGVFVDESRANAAREKSEELGTELKSITQLYNDYACRFELWEVCLEILHFSNYSGDAENSVMRETWTRLLDQALAVGGVGEACSVLRRVGPLLYPGDGGSMPLHTICLHLETAAHDKMCAGSEVVGDEDIPRALLAACKGAAEPVQRNYDRVLASGAILPKPSLRLRILRSVLTVMREWANSVLYTRAGSGVSGGFLLFGGAELALSNQGMRDKLASIANRYMTEVRRIALAPGAVEPVLHGFRELEEILKG